MKITSNQIILVIVSFLAGILVASAFTVNQSKTPEDKMTEKEITEQIREGEKENEAVKMETVGESPATTAPSTTQAVSVPSYSGTCTPAISGYKDTKLNAIVISWTPCESEDFQFYKILKSSKNPNPSYPADPVVVSSSNKSLNNHIDKTVTRATTYYYRACVVQRLNQVSCGNIVSVTY